MLQHYRNFKVGFQDLEVMSFIEGVYCIYIYIYILNKMLRTCTMHRTTHIFKLQFQYAIKFKIHKSSIIL